jgi:hypothetical protein
VPICFTFALIAMVIVGSLSEAVAQPYYYPPPQRDYYGPPPNHYGPAPGGYYPQDSPSYVTPLVPSVTVGGAAPAPAGKWIAGLPPADQPESNQSAELPPQFRRQLVAYVAAEPAGTIIIDTPRTFLYLVLGHGEALRYGVGVGRNGFTWSGTERISRMSKWPDWHPPKEMIARQPYLPPLRPAVKATQWERAPSISATPSIASTAPINRQPLAISCRQAASA